MKCSAEQVQEDRDSRRRHGQRRYCKKGQARVKLHGYIHIDIDNDRLTLRWSSGSHSLPAVETEHLGRIHLRNKSITYEYIFNRGFIIFSFMNTRHSLIHPIHPILFIKDYTGQSFYIFTIFQYLSHVQTNATHSFA